MPRRLGRVLVIAIAVVALALTVLIVRLLDAAAQTSPPPNESTEAKLERSRRYARRLEGVVRREVTRAERNERRLRRSRHQLRRMAQTRPSIHRTIQIAALAYEQSYSGLLRKARCESGLWPYARNPSSGAAGLFQFLPSTWRSTPFAGVSIYDPFANALAASWMHRAGRGGEWVCR